VGPPATRDTTTESTQNTVTARQFETTRGAHPKVGMHHADSRDRTHNTNNHPEAGEQTNGRAQIRTLWTSKAAESFSTDLESIKRSQNALRTRPNKLGMRLNALQRAREEESILKHGLMVSLKQAE
jgi:hypothetical protein